ncbi:carbon storage regulator [Stutzerimonas stutzeri]|uniref:Translational regulator CsrA n=1 Tax=Stutzerimonas stutzeri TaxID=316 RepID=A0AA42P839_STUST|nr:carbon storage regulator [Stutzerimonas stutzeri]MDH1236506.1 carbon storage regulator [Stutzerimonas stutzeri]
MLVITRKAGEAVHIGDNIVVRILGTQNGQTRIGIDAPKEIEIQRDNIKNKKKSEVVSE